MSLIDFYLLIAESNALNGEIPTEIGKCIALEEIGFGKDLIGKRM